MPGKPGFFFFMNKISVTINNKSFFIYIRDDADESVAAEIFKQREYRIAEDIIRDAKDSVIDVGSHVGFFTLYARLLNENVPIIAIEPDPKNIEQLKKHLRENNISSVTVIEGAVAADAGRRHLALAKDSHNHRLLGRAEPKDGKSVIVNTWSLSDILKKCIINSISLVKIDIEGGEYELFRGINPEDFKKINSFVIEYHLAGGKNQKVIEDILRENGFGVRVFPSKFDKKMGFIFAVNKRK